MNTLKLGFTRISNCKICGGPAHYFDVVDFNKFCSQQNFYQFGLLGEAVFLLRCEACEFIFTEHCDTWTEADFASRIYNNDYVLVDGEYKTIRPTVESERFASAVSDGKNLAILDFGSGTGIFGERLKDHMFSNVESYDPFSSPTRPRAQFDVITAIEVIEHSPNPHETIRDILSFAKHNCAIIFTTLLQPDDIAVIRGRHWYLAPRNGHVCFYNTAALCSLAAQFGLSYHLHKSYHAFVRGVSPISIDSAPVQYIRLTAPITGAALPSWNGVERPDNGPRRWTALSSVEWRLTNAGPIRATLSIPFISEVSPGFANGCTISANGASTSTVVVNTENGNELKARVDLPNANSIITLTTPSPVRPCDLNRNKDARQLGLLVPCGETVEEKSVIET